VFIWSGCNFLSERVFRRSTTASKKDNAYVHHIKWQGEILSVIASWYTGDMNNWRTIAKSNPDLNPKKIAIGDKIRIPSALLITRKPMPKSYLIEFYAKPKIKSPSHAPAIRPKVKGKASTPAPSPQPKPTKKQAQPESEKEPELFGPKGYSK
jgi:hypothetical protein